jgi:hypothetical protein
MDAGVALQTRVATDSCPWCGTVISRGKFLEIEKRIADLERKKFAAEREKMEAQIRAEAQKAGLHEKEENEKKLAALAEKLKAAEVREAAIKKEAAAQAEAKANAEAEKKLIALSKERDQATAKAKELEEARQKELERTRAALEKDRDAQLSKKEAEHSRERQKWQQKFELMTRQLQRKTADELGEGAELDIYEALRDSFSTDHIVRIKKGQPGADIRHEVQHKGQSCGIILIDSKNRQGWQNSYVQKLREDQMTAKADYAVLATTVFPSGKKELYVDQETRVIVVHRERTVEVMGLLRRLMVRVHATSQSNNQRAEKQEQVFKYISSEDFRQHLIEGARLAGELLELDVEEKRGHEKVWEKRGKMVTRLRNVNREIDTEVSAILEGKR